MDSEIVTIVKYPPFRKYSKTLEEEIYEIWTDEGLNECYQLIRINWTNITNQWPVLNKDGAYIEKIRTYFSSLDAEKKYIIISQHDDLFPREII